MRLDPAIVDHVARLARLELTEEERDHFRRQLTSILDYCSMLNELDTEHIEPTSHVITLTNVVRDDIPDAPLAREAVLAAAPEHEDGYFKVPPVLEMEPPL
ncbi:MAG: asparaginyl/glutamyl-tRNA amidotransferase subunit C [Armatimonadetes bacterium 13_1_40CM_64_14]|nr:MAG: asparaginyl/glutamyl-tRNA amidotransferase subunit C [Armatimonadetes bacterium 13_1_40CM_64_14]